MSKNAELLAVAEAAARSTGAILRVHAPITTNSLGKDIKIDADQVAHAVLSKALYKTGIPVLSEEDERHDFSLEYVWVVDPLDGSLNFLRDIPICAVSLCLVKDGAPILGAVYDFNRDEMFSAIIGEGAWLNRQVISVSDVKDKGRAVLATGFPSYTDYSNDALQQYISHIQSFKKVRLLGSAALSLAYVASGRADAYYEKDIRFWDVAAGLALVKSAGGVYSCTEISKDGKCTVSASNANALIDLSHL